jgi:hypothetical protein
VRDWVRTVVSAVCGGVIVAMLVVEGVVVAAAEYDPRGVNVHALLLFGGIGLGASLVAWLVRRRDRGDVAGVLASRGELPEDDLMAVAAELADEPTVVLDRPGWHQVQDGIWVPDRPAGDGDGYVWPEAAAARIEAQMRVLDRTNGRADEAYKRDAFYLLGAEEAAWVECMNDLRRPPVPVVPGKSESVEG